MSCMSTASITDISPAVGRQRHQDATPLRLLTSSDFPVPNSLILQLANAPSPIFFNSYALDALPQLNGSMSYVTSSLPLTSVSRS